MDLKLSPDLFLGLQELQYFKNSIKDEGYKKLFQKSVSRYGVVKTPTDTLFTSLKVIAGSSNKVTIKAGIAIDKNIQFIEVLNDLTDYFTIPSDSVPRYIVIKYNTTSIEDGTVAIAANGTVTGTGTLFTERIRGGAENPTKISFPNSSVNTGEYTVLAVQSDTHLTLNVAGSLLTVESGKQYATVGCFTPGIAIDTNNKYPFVRDSYTIELRTSSTLVDGEEFILAKVINDGANLIISERRPSNKFSLIPVDDDIVSPTNPIIGVESIKYQNFRNPSDKNLVKIGWSWSTVSWSVNQDKGQITLNNGSGGIWTQLPALLIPGHTFIGWWVLFESTGRSFQITGQSNPAGLWVFDMEYDPSYPLSGGNVSIIPNCDLVEIVVTNANNSTANQIHSFATTSGSCVIELEAGTQSLIKWRHTKADKTTPLVVLNSGQYYAENSYNINGEVIELVQTPYVSGLITPMVSPLNFYDNLFPGVIVMWAGDPNILPPNFFLCDGNNGTPDLSSRFVVGYKAGDDIYGTIGGVGGEAESKLVLTNLPPIIPQGVIQNTNHSHSYKDAFYAEVFDWSSIPAGFGQEVQDNTVIGAGNSDLDNNHLYYKVRSTEVSVDFNPTFLGTAFGGQDGQALPFSNLPPYYILAFIMKKIPTYPSVSSTVTGGLIDLDTLPHCKSDEDAGTNFGVLVGKPYKLSADNIYGSAFGLIKIREI